LRDTEPALVASPGELTENADIDATLAGLVRQALVELARHSPAYAKIFADRAGARLAYHVSAGQIEHLSADGRAAMQRVYLMLQAALTVEPGLDANAFRTRLARAQR
jgi:hypothetical protein